MVPAMVVIVEQEFVTSFEVFWRTCRYAVALGLSFGARGSLQNQVARPAVVDGYYVTGSRNLANSKHRNKRHAGGVGRRSQDAGTLSTGKLHPSKAVLHCPLPLV